AEGGSDLKQQRLNSYVTLVKGPRIAQAVVDRLHLPMSTKQMQAKISAEVEPGTLLLVVTATDRSPSLARDIVTAAAAELVALAQELEPARPAAAAPTVTIAVAPVAVASRSPAPLPANAR